MSHLLILFLVVFLLNLIPVFAPPTWMVFSFLGLRFPNHFGWNLVFIGAVAATLGRCLLANASQLIVRNRWMSEAAKGNVDSLRQKLEQHPKLTSSVFLFYAFTPLPSNYLFIAYGLTAMRLARVAVPFFLGRFASYSFWVFGSAAVARRLEFEDINSLGYFSAYFVVTQLTLLGIVYAFTRIDWRVLLQQRKWRWIGKSGTGADKPEKP